MSKAHKHIILLFAISFIFITGCKRPIESSTPLPNKGVPYVTKNLERTVKNPDWYGSKIATKLYQKGEKNTFKTSVRIRRDSLIWLSIMKGPIPVAKAMITKDSIKAVVTINKQYLEKDYDFLKEKFGMELDYYMLQELLLGNPIGYNKRENYKLLKDSSFYLLSTHNKRQLEKALERLPRNEEKQYIMRYWINPSTFKTKNMLFNHLSDSSSLEINNISFKQEDEFMLPAEINLEAINPRDTVSIEMNVSKFKINKELSFPFKINPNYTKIE